MEAHPGLGPGEQVNHGAVTTPRIAASVIVVRGGAAALELLLVQRSPAARFMGGVWVFPGGAVDPGDGATDDPDQLDWALRAAALREVAEEAGIGLGDPELLVPFSRWITPAHLVTRFDTWFFLAHAPAGAEPRADGGECVDARWATPADALADHRAGRLPLVFPTIKLLEQLARFGTAEQLLTHAAEQEIVTVEPRVVMVRDQTMVLLPGDPGYERAGRGAGGR